MTEKKSFRVGVFIDGSNLFWAQRILLNNPELASWKLDHTKLKAHLDNKYSPTFYKYFSTEDVNPTNDTFRERAQREAGFRHYLTKLGYEMITKPLKYIFDHRTGTTKTKGDMDIEIVQSINKSLDDIDMICLVAGDSDYMVAVKDWYLEGKYIQIYSYKHILSRELRDFCYTTPGASFTFLDDIREEVEKL